MFPASVTADLTKGAASAVPFLRQLAAERQWLIEFLEREQGDPDLTNPYRYGVIIQRTLNYAVRLCVWRPEEDDEQHAHTHDFDLYTIGLSGPGYTTEMWACDAVELACAEVGAEVTRFDALGPMTLSQGQTFYYPAHTIAHRQLAPAAYSMSLNVIFRNALVLPQVFIDPATRRIVRKREPAQESATV